MVFVNLDDSARPINEVYAGLEEEIRGVMPEFDDLKLKFPSASEHDFRKFKKNHSIDTNSKIEFTGMPIEQALRDKSGNRWDIFGEFRDGRTVAEFFQAAKKITSRAERDHDMFIALHKGYVRLVPTGRGTGMGK